jgi:hypothetical protein
MGAIAFSLGDLTPQMICAGWVRLRPFGGVASVVMRIQVDGAGQNCEGLLPTSMAEVTFPRDPMTPAGSNPTTTAESGSPRTQRAQGRSTAATRECVAGRRACREIPVAFLRWLRNDPRPQR